MLNPIHFSLLEVTQPFFTFLTYIECQGLKCPLKVLMNVMIQLLLLLSTAFYQEKPYLDSPKRGFSKIKRVLLEIFLGKKTL